MLARGSHNMILFNSFNKFSIKPTLIQYPLLITLLRRSLCDEEMSYDKSQKLVLNLLYFWDLSRFQF
jgi:hypothetical protein